MEAIILTQQNLEESSSSSSKIFKLKLKNLEESSRLEAFGERKGFLNRHPFETKIQQIIQKHLPKDVEMILLGLPAPFLSFF